MKVLVLNSGSSSVKFQLFECDGGNEVLAKGVAERIGLEEPELSCSCPRKPKGTCDLVDPHPDIADHQAAIDVICRYLLSKECGVIRDLSELAGIGHRVVHGGERFTGSVLINDEVVHGIEECARLAPLHNPPALLGIRACSKIFANIPQVAVFDTAFYHTIPPECYMYGIPIDIYRKHQVRKYGFHGTSHMYVSQEAAKMLDKDPADTRIITWPPGQWQQHHGGEGRDGRGDKHGPDAFGRRDDGHAARRSGSLRADLHAARAGHEHR